MNLEDLLKKIDVTVINNFVNSEIVDGYTSDLLSDVIANAKAGSLWITLQTHKNIVAVATMKQIPAIIITSGRRPEKDVIDAANEESIVLISTNMNNFECSGKLYKILKNESF